MCDNLSILQMTYQEGLKKSPKYSFYIKYLRQQHKWVRPWNFTLTDPMWAREDKIRGAGHGALLSGFPQGAQPPLYGFRRLPSLPPLHYANTLLRSQSEQIWALLALFPEKVKPEQNKVHACPRHVPTPTPTNGVCLLPSVLGTGLSFNLSWCIA